MECKADSLCSNFWWPAFGCFPVTHGELHRPCSCLSSAAVSHFTCKWLLCGCAWVSGVRVGKRAAVGVDALFTLASNFSGETSIA